MVEAGLIAGGALYGMILVALAVPVVVSALYLWLAVKYWFRIPVAGTAIATALFAIALLG